jgi:hypothetical protein
MSQPERVPAPSSSVRQSVYPSKVDWWIAALLLAGPLACAFLTLWLLTRGENREAMTCLLVGAGTLLVTALVTVPCRYTLLPDCLSIRCGLYFTRIPLDHIRAIEPSGSWISGPALSVRRVKISTASRYYLVSPTDRERFINELTAAVQRSGD